MHMRRSKLRTSSWSGEHQTKNHQQISADYLNHCEPSRGGGWALVGGVGWCGVVWGRVVWVCVCAWRTSTNHKQWHLSQIGWNSKWLKHPPKKTIKISSFGKRCLSLGVGLDLLLSTFDKRIKQKTHRSHNICVTNRCDIRSATNLSWHVIKTSNQVFSF